MKRSKQTLSHFRLISAEMGELIPIQCVPVLPGDTAQGSSEAVIRLSPLNTPVMHPTVARIHHWYLPNRVVWPQSENGGWEEFITGGPDGNNSQTIPQGTQNNLPKSLFSMLGVPPWSGRSVNALPRRMYNQIWNKRYRDQLLEAEVADNSAVLQNCAWEKDYYTTARPFTQLGPDVSLPIGTKADVVTDAAAGADLLIRQGNTNNWRKLDSDAAHVDLDATDVPGGTNEIYADLSSGAINVNDFRTVFGLQRYQEARMRYGARFTEYLRYLGVTPSDQRIQDPEYLGGGTARLQFSEVLQTAGTTDGSGDGVGDLYGHGIAGIRSNRFRKFFEEHGYIISLLSVRPKSIYKDAVHRDWLKLTKEDYWQRELQHIGQQEIQNKEMHLGHTTPDGTFGWQDRYEEYRRHPSQIFGDFRSTLSSWSMFRDLPNTVALNGDFVKCAPSKRIFQVTTGDPLWIMVNNRLVVRRMVAKRANPRIM